MNHGVHVCKADIAISDITVPGEPPPLGNAPEVRQGISARYPRTDWADPGRGVLAGDCWVVVFVLPRDGEVNHIVLEISHVHEPEDCKEPERIVRGVCDANGWGAYNVEDDGFLLMTEA